MAKRKPVDRAPDIHPFHAPVDSTFDIVNRYGMAQYLVLLSNTTLENCYKIQKRINAGFMENRQRIHVKYSVMDIYSGKTEKNPV